MALAAARDGEIATEVEKNGRWRGDFTAALVAALTELPAGATYRDILADARLRMLEGGVAQHPRGEGDLGRRFLSVAPVERRVFEATRGSAGDVRLAAGTLAGVVEGSTFALFRTSTDAIDKAAKPLGTGKVVRAGPASAELKLDAPVAVERLFARETARQFKGGPLKVKVTGADTRRTTDAGTRLRQSGVVEVVDAEPQLVLETAGDEMVVKDLEGRELTRFPAAQLDEMSRRLAGYFALLSLRNAAAPPSVDLQFEKVTCVPPKCARTEPVGPAALGSAGDYVFQPGECFRLAIRNTGKTARHVYLLNLRPSFAIRLDHPLPVQGQEADPPLAPGATLPVRGAYCVDDKPRREFYMVIATDQPVDLAALQQDAVRTGPLSDPLSNLIQSARGGVRSGGLVEVQDWGVVLRSAITEAPRAGAGT